MIHQVSWQVYKCLLKREAFRDINLCCLLRHNLLLPLGRKDTLHLYVCVNEHIFNILAHFTSYNTQVFIFHFYLMSIPMALNCLWSRHRWIKIIWKTLMFRAGNKYLCLFHNCSVHVFQKDPFITCIWFKDCHDKYKIILRGSVNRDIKVRKRCDMWIIITIY